MNLHVFLAESFEVNYPEKMLLIFLVLVGVGGAVRFLVVGTIGQEERPPQGQL